MGWHGGKGSKQRPTDRSKYDSNWDAIFNKKDEGQQAQLDVIPDRELTLDDLESKIIQWGYDKGILPNGIAEKQLEKTLEEVNELKDAVAEKNLDEIKDAIGDIVVTLVMQAAVQGTTLRECVEQAYDVISKRTGKMIDGLFVKDK